MGSLREQFLIRRGDVWYFRRVFPNHIRTRLQKREIKLSLQTQSRDIARRRCRALANAYEVLVERWWEMSELPLGVIHKLVRSYFAEALHSAKEAAESANQQIEITYQRSDEIDMAEGEQALLKKEMTGFNFGGYTTGIAELLVKESGLEMPVKGGKSWKELCRTIIRARMEENRIYLALLKGDYGELEPKDPLFKQGAEEVFGAVEVSGMEELIASNCNPYPTVGELAAKFIALKSVENWEKKTKRDNERVLSWFEELVGKDTPINHIKKEHTSRFRDLMLGIPANFSQKPAYKGMSVLEAEKACKKGDQNSGKTAKKYLGMLKGFLNWCVDEEHIHSVPGAKVTVPGISNSVDDRYPFSNTQLKAIFSSPVYTGCKSKHRRYQSGDLILKDGKYWIPLIGLYTGMRLGEIVQLHIADVMQEGDIWFFNVTTQQDDESEELEKGTKTEQSKRRIPIHHELVEFGFLEYLVTCQSKQNFGPRLFPDIKPSADGYYSGLFSKNFAYFLKAIEVKTKKTCFHSFRHNFKETLDKAGVQDSHQDALMGHIDTTQSKNIYGSGKSVTDLAKDIEKVSYKSIF